MSQEKVDKYKQEKANRKKIMKKEKLASALRKCAVGVVGLVLVGWIGYSAYNMYESKREIPSVEVDYQALDDFSQNLSGAADGADAADADAADTDAADTTGTDAQE